MLLLAVWLLLTGVLALVHRLNFSYSGEVLAVLALLAGICLLLGR
jgi:hypothetical protein